MKRTTLAFVFAMSLIPLALAVRGGAQSSGVLDEGAVEGSSSTGGSMTVVAGYVNGPVDFSVTGRFSDLSSVRDRYGNSFGEVPVRDLWNNPPYPLISRGKYQLPDGRSRVLLRIPNADASFNGGQVRLRSGSNPGLLLDADPISLR